MRECVSEGVSEGVECGAGLILHAFLCTYSVSKCSVLVCVVCDPQAGQFVQESLYAAAMTLFALEQYEEAMELCGELISQNPDSPQVRSSALLEEAL